MLLIQHKNSGGKSATGGGKNKSKLRKHFRPKLCSKRYGDMINDKGESSGGGRVGRILFTRMRQELFVFHYP